MTTVKEHIENLNKYNPKDHVCLTIWTREDIIWRIDQLVGNVEFHDEDLDWILEQMEHNHDANYGISWDTIDWWIDIVAEEKRELERREKTNA